MEVDSLNFIKELETFRFDKTQMNKEQIEFVNALKLITDGKESLATKSLSKLWFNAKNAVIHKNSGKILFDLYFNQSNWNQIELSGLLNESSIDKTNRIIAEQCNQFETAEFSFSENKICVPLKQSATGSTTIEVMINGKKKWFWLDTGAGMTVISNSLAEVCGINKIQNNEMQIGNSTNQYLNSDLAVIDSMKIGDLSIKNQPTLVLLDELLTIPLPHAKEPMIVDGIIGWDIIHQLVLELDYQKHQIKIQKPERKNDLEQNLFFCGYPIIKVQDENNIPLFFGLDTGANKTHFGQSIFTKVNNLKVKQRKIQRGGIGEMKEREINYIENLNLYFTQDLFIRLENLNEVLVNYATFFKLDGVFGVDIIKNKRVIIDYENRNIQLVKEADCN